MFVTSGAKTKLYDEEKRQFLEEEWPRIMIRIRRLGLTLEELNKHAGPAGGNA